MVCKFYKQNFKSTSNLFISSVEIEFSFFLQVPFYGKTGLSSGIALMNLTRIRHMSSKSWTREIMDIFYRYERDLVYGDQDILNIYFNKVTGSLPILSR